MMKKILLATLLVTSALLQTLTLVQAQTTVTLYPVADNYADSKYPNLGKYGRTTILYVGNSYDREQNIWGSERIYIRFDLTGLPRDSVIVQATLRLWQFFPPKSNQTYEAHRVLGDWKESTENWNDQPSSSPTETSETVAPPRGAQGAEVPVEWDITTDVEAWYTANAVNYGTMIKVANEERAADASSGFWSREYPVEEVKPKLIVVLRMEPASAYVVTVGTVGLGIGTLSTMTVDRQAYSSLNHSRVENVTFHVGTVHTIAVSDLVPGPPGVRYRCDSNETQVSSSASLFFVYSVEYSVTFLTHPNDFFITPASGWYIGNTTLPVKRTGPDTIETAPGTRLRFDGWYLNSKRLTVEQTTITVNEPVTLEGRYVTEYLLNVTSPVGETRGSGWYADGSAASFSIDSTSVSAGGSLGLLGLKRSFSQWVGSNDFLGVPTEPQGSVIMRQPTAIVAVWEDDYSSLVTNFAAVLLVAAIAVTVIVKALRRRGRSGSTARA